MRIPSDFPLAAHIDQTLLRPSATAEEVQKAAREAVRYGFAAFCVAPCMVEAVAPILRGTATVVDTVIGFPLGFQTTSVKSFEARETVRQGAQELDLVVNRGWLKAGRDEWVRREIEAVVAAVAPIPVKAILEISDLTSDEILRACDAVARAGAHYVKTSTGFFGTGATLESVRIIKSRLGDRLKIKASGGIKDLAAAWAFIQAGASRIGSSSGAEIMKAFDARA